MLTMVNIFNVFKYGLTGLLLFIDSLVYWLLSVLFGLYEALAKVDFINAGDYENIASRFYVLIGVVMLFYLTYSLLKTLVNPDDLKNVSKISTNLVISLVLLGVMPLVFSYLFELQDIIISDNVVGRVVLGSENNNITNSGTTAAFMILNTFLNPEHADIKGDSGQTWGEFQANFEGGNTNGSAFLDLTDFAEPIHEQEDGVTYKPLISTACGIFLVYVLVSFCIDLGKRVVKLSFYQIIAPIPILMRIIPEKKSVFDNWVKGTVATFLEVFIRLFIMFIIIFLMTLILSKVDMFSEIGLFGNVMVILGLFAFAKEAPKLLGDVIGVDSGSIKLGIGGKLAAGGAFGMGAVLGGGLTAGVRGLTSGIGNVMSANGIMNKSRAIARAFGGTAGGFVSGGVRGGKAGFSAKNVQDMAKAASQAASAVDNKRADREKFRATYGDGITGLAKGFASETTQGIKAWATGSSAGILNKVKEKEEMKNAYEEYKAIYENPKYKEMDSQLQHLKTLQAQGATTTAEGTNIKTAIESLNSKMLEERLNSIRSNTQATAYAMYNYANEIKKNPSLAKELGIDASRFNDLILKGGKVLDKQTNQEITAEKLYSAIEGSAFQNVTYDKNAKKYIDSISNLEVDFKDMIKQQDSLKDAIKFQNKTISDSIRSDKMSIAYKEANKRQEASKK